MAVGNEGPRCGRQRVAVATEREEERSHPEETPSPPVEQMVTPIAEVSIVPAKNHVLTNHVTLTPSIATMSAVDSTTDMLLEISNMTDKEIGRTYSCVRVEEQVKQFCKKTLFHLLKFVINKSDLANLRNPYDIGNVVMNGLHITDDKVKARWWLLYQGVVKKTLDTQRSNCNMAIKTVMVGK